jgi:hypothetical protein
MSSSEASRAVARRFSDMADIDDGERHLGLLERLPRSHPYSAPASKR